MSVHPERSRRVSASSKGWRVVLQEFVPQSLRAALHEFDCALRAPLTLTLLVAVLLFAGAAFAQDSELPVPSPPPPPPHVEPIPNEVPPPPDAPPPVPPAEGPPPQQVQPGAEEPLPPPAVPPARRTRERAREYGRDPEEPQRPDWRTPRKGFHFSAGLGGMVYPGQSNGAHSSVEAVGYVAVLPAVSYSWGWLEAHLTVQALGYLTSESKALFVAADPQLRINFAPWYSLGFGPYLGVAASPKLEGVAGLSISPIIFKLGDRGQHEVALWSATPFLFTNNHSGISLLLLSYSFVFI